MLTGCKGKTIQGQGNIKKQSYHLKNFSKLDIARDFNVKVSNGEEFSISVETNSDIFKYLEIKVANDTLYANYKEDIVIEKTDINMEIVMPVVSNIKLQNDSKLKLQNNFEYSGDFIIDMSNDAELIGALNVDNLKVMLENDATCTLIDGRANTITADLYNDGSIMLKELKVVSGIVNLQNNAKCNIYITDKLDVTAKNDSTVHVYGGGKVNKVDVEEDAVVESIKE